MRRLGFNHTIYASYLGYITQAIVNNFVPLLFIHFATEFKLDLRQITLLTTLNFSIQLAVDFISSKVVDKIGYRVCLVAAHAFSAAGFVSLAFLPSLLSAPYAGILVSVVLYAVGGGIIEVLISPVVEACPTKKKEAAMSLLHSFYCWGHLFLILASTAFFHFAGIKNWRILALLWALVPLLNMFYFLAVPLYTIPSSAEKSRFSFLGNPLFWVLFVMMICSGASEQAMSQWASAFAERSLHISKTAGDLVGPATFALCMGTSRALYGKFSAALPLKKAMVMSAVLCIAAYLLAVLFENPLLGMAGCALCGFSVGIFWPGTFSLIPKTIPDGGTALYALLALAGDVGCASGPSVTGFVASATGGQLKNGLALAMVFPVLIIVGIALLGKRKKSVH